MMYIPAGKTKPCVVVDGRDKAGFKRWRKNTLHPTPVSKTMTAAQLLVSTSMTIRSNIMGVKCRPAKLKVLALNYTWREIV